MKRIAVVTSGGDALQQRPQEHCRQKNTAGPEWLELAGILAR
jgi:hypothetical protein